MPPEELGMDGHWRWLSGPSDRPLANMAIDRAIFESHGGRMTPATVRVYRWGRPAVTIGRLQDANKAMAAFPGLPCLRRPTGGRAVAHGGDLTITVAAREEILRPLLERRGVLASYHLLLAPIAAALEEYGIGLVAGTRRAREDRSEDCFAQAAGCDLVDQETGAKALGSAQLRSGGVVLQQMSLRPLQKVEIGEAEFEERLRRHFGRVLRVREWRVEQAPTAWEWSKAKESGEDVPSPVHHSTKETDD